MLLDLDENNLNFTTQNTKQQERSDFVAIFITDVPIETQVFAAMILWERLFRKLEQQPGLKDNFLELIAPAMLRGRDELRYEHMAYYPHVCGYCYRYYGHHQGFRGDVAISCSFCDATIRYGLYPLFLSIAPLFLSHDCFLKGQHHTLAARLIYQHYSKGYPEC